MTATITKDFFDPKVPSEGRVVYFKPNGNDANSGDSYATCVQTLSQAITLATALTPTASDPVTIISDTSFEVTGNYTLPDNTNLFAPGLRMLSSNASPALSMGTNCRVDVDTIDNDSTGTAVLYNGKIFTTLACNGIQALSGKAVEHVSGSYGNYIKSSSIRGGTHCIYNSSASTEPGLQVDASLVAVLSNNAIAVECTSVNEVTLDCDKIYEASAITGSVAFQGTGVIHAEVDFIDVDTAFQANNGAQITAYCGNVTGDINTVAGGSLNCWILSYSGTLTNNGTMNGAIAGDYYGTFIQGAFTNTVQVNTLSDLPAPSAGVITLADDTLYLQAPFTSISLGTDRIEVPNTSAYEGVSNCTLSYTGTGTMFTVSGTAEVFTMSNITISCNSGTFITETGSNNFIQLSDMAVYCGTIATTFAPLFFRAANFLFANFATGLSISSTGTKCIFDTGTFEPTTGTLTCVDLNSSTFDQVTMHNCGFTFADVNNTGIDGAATSGNINSGGFGIIRGCRFTGSAGTPYASNIKTDDARWRMITNTGADNTAYFAALYITAANEAATVISGTGAGNEVLVAGTWTEDSSSLMTVTSGGRVTYDGDEARSFLVACQARIDPATGSNKAYTFHYKINGGSVEPLSRCTVQASAGTPINVEILGRFTLNNGDYIELFVQNDTDTTNCTIKSPTFIISES